MLNDSKYGWDKPADNTSRLRRPHTPVTKGGYAHQNKQDFGHHTFTYSIVGHAGDYRAGGAVRKAEVLNQPLRAFVAPRHGGVLGRSFSLASAKPHVALRALKQAEDSDEYVVRFYETSGLGRSRPWWASRRRPSTPGSSTGGRTSWATRSSAAASRASRSGPSA